MLPDRAVELTRQLIDCVQDARTACDEAGLSSSGELIQLRARLRAKYEPRHNWRRLRRMRPVIAAVTSATQLGMCVWFLWVGHTATRMHFKVIVDMLASFCAHRFATRKINYRLVPFS